VKIYILEDPDPDYPFLPEIYLAGHDYESIAVTQEKAAEIVSTLSGREFGVVFNLCDGSRYDSGRPGIEVVRALEAHRIPFTGADSSFFEPTRTSMKEACRALGIETPEWVFVKDAQNLEQLTGGLKYPLIVKHANSYASIGLLPESRVDDLAELETQVRRMTGEYGEVLIEEFIAGREFSVLVAENPDDRDHPKVYPPVECTFPEGESFKHEKLKWETFQDMHCIPIHDPALEARLRSMSEKMFLGMNGNGFGRCDIRSDSSGKLYMLEINPNCGIFYPPDAPGTADSILQLDGGHARFVQLLLRGALSRRQRTGFEQVQSGEVRSEK
jgi:D-alanine-D-alanine ligase